MTTQLKHASDGQWIGEPLHDFLTAAFPGYVDKNGGLVVMDLANEMGMSREGFYKWLRNGRLSKPGVEKLHNFAVSRHGHDAPTREEFSKFLFA